MLHVKVSQFMPFYVCIHVIHHNLHVYCVSVGYMNCTTNVGYPVRVEACTTTPALLTRVVSLDFAALGVLIYQVQGQMYKVMLLVSLSTCSRGVASSFCRHILTCMSLVLEHQSWKVQPSHQGRLTLRNLSYTASCYMQYVATILTLFTPVCTECNMSKAICMCVAGANFQ